MGQTASCTPVCGDPCHGGGCQGFGPGAGKAAGDVGGAFAAATAQGKVPGAANGTFSSGHLPEVPAAVQAAVATAAQAPPNQFVEGEKPATARFGDGGTVTTTPVRLVSFEALLAKEPGSNFGIAHTQIEEGGASMLLICDLRLDGPAAKWNEECVRSQQSQRAIQRGDRILGIDGKADMDVMRGLLKNDQVRLSIERWPDVYTVPLKKVSPSDRFGMRTELIRRPDGGRSLLITQVANGLLSDWNERAQASKKFCDVVTPDTEIVQVGGVRGEPKAMQEELLRSTCIDVMLRRASPRELQRGARRLSSTQASPVAGVPIDVYDQRTTPQ